ncbi:uncharacterized protein LOC117119292 [Anneissia japonica]|uniref:uncharacterized protein LOC117119292 n=1 Tax=Anneissia japonica TaxID=1529436 RepID=UPI0014257C83|nr:uncharacterized protein LOC117119292 [Anneissia japonica]
MLRENNYVTKAYKLSRTPRSNSVNVSASVYVTQGGDQSKKYSETLQILTHTNDELPPKPKRTSLLLKQPLRLILKSLLDPDGMSDWRMFAHKLNLDDVIPKLEKDTRRSATYELLNIWESIRSGDDAADWNNLERIFEEIGRKDVITEILIAKSESSAI